MDEQLEKTLSKVAIETFEKLAFLFAFHADETATGQPDSGVAASVSFAGFFSGTLVMKVSAESLPELAANMLGVDEDDETAWDQQHDALKETLNVICGNFLSAITGGQEVFDIGAPEIIAEDEAAKKSSGQKSICKATLAFEEGQCELSLFGEDRIPLNIRLTGRE